MTSGCRGTSHFRRYNRELVLKPPISLKKSWGGYRRTTLRAAAIPWKRFLELFATGYVAVLRAVQYPPTDSAVYRDPNRRTAEWYADRSHNADCDASACLAVLCATEQCIGIHTDVPAVVWWSLQKHFTTTRGRCLLSVSIERPEKAKGVCRCSGFTGKRFG